MDDRSEADRILLAKIWGEVRFRVRWRDLTAEEEVATVAALRELAGGRGDLLAEAGGLIEGAGHDELDEPLTRQAAGLCRQAGADPAAFQGWVEEGQRRSANARQPPFSGACGHIRTARINRPNLA
ncbi:MAG TPA: hypothetical protein VHZ03_17085 [Trebonia sp.]|nr:hypothetical protein [Trebonia sp.]